MSLRTYDAGTFVGNGPSVSVGATVQVPFVPAEVFAVPEPEVVLLSVVPAFLQASIITGVEIAPIIKLLMKFFLSMATLFCFVKIKVANLLLSNSDVTMYGDFVSLNVKID